MLTQEQKAALCEEYKDRSNKVEVIAQKYGVSRSEVVRLAVKMGAEPRRKVIRKREQNKTCPKCKKTVDVKGAKFRCFCGTDMRSNKELLIERIENAFADILLMPQNARDDMQKLFIDIINELKE